MTYQQPPDPYEDLILDNLTVAPPSAHVQEMGLLGAVLRKPAIYDNLRDMLAATDFEWHCYGWVWSAFESLHSQGMRIDVIAVGDELEREKKLNEFMLDGADGVTFGGRAGLSKIREMGEPQSAETYAAKVLDYAAKRRILQLMNKGAEWSLNGRTADDIKNDLAQTLEKIATWNGKAASHTQTIGEAVTDAYNRLDMAARGEISCIQTELIDLDRILSGGLYAPDLILVAGRPGHGKSALLDTITKNVAEKKKRVVHFGLEMANRQTAERLLAQISGVSTDRQRSGKLLDGEWPLYTHAIEVLADMPIALNDMPAISPARMRQVLRRLPGFDLIVVDYVQLQKSDEKHKNRYQEVDSVSYDLKAIAKEFDVPVLAAAQMSRAVEQRQSKRPILSDLRESGGLEQASDIVIFIYPNEERPNITELIVAKHRNGATGSVELVFRPSVTKFESAVTKHIEFNNWEKRKDIS